jgi:hypothetical protein
MVRTAVVTQNIEEEPRVSGAVWADNIWVAFVSENWGSRFPCRLSLSALYKRLIGR